MLQKYLTKKRQLLQGVVTEGKEDPSSVFNFDEHEVEVVVVVTTKMTKNVVFSISFPISILVWLHFHILSFLNIIYNSDLVFAHNSNYSLLASLFGLGPGAELRAPNCKKLECQINPIHMYSFYFQTNFFRIGKVGPLRLS